MNAKGAKEVIVWNEVRKECDENGEKQAKNQEEKLT